MNLPERFRIAYVAWARADGNASRLEEMKKIIYAEIFNQSRDGTVADRENRALVHPTYAKHITMMVEARTQANVHKADWMALSHEIEMWRTMESTKRAEMQHLAR
jgi:hypothetical protein